MQAIQLFINGLRQNRAGRGTVAVAVCSAHRDVLSALFRTARRHKRFALIESTAEQVNIDGGYTGMTPKDFVAHVLRIAREENYPMESILLGGDHLGPHPWRGLPADQAMEKAKQLVAGYLDAGYRKIHLDTSMSCRDDRSSRLIARRRW